MVKDNTTHAVSGIEAALHHNQMKDLLMNTNSMNKCGFLTTTTTTIW